MPYPELYRCLFAFGVSTSGRSSSQAEGCHPFAREEVEFEWEKRSGDSTDRSEIVGSQSFVPSRDWWQQPTARSPSWYDCCPGARTLVPAERAVASVGSQWEYRQLRRETECPGPRAPFVRPFGRWLR